MICFFPETVKEVSLAYSLIENILEAWVKSFVYNKNNKGPRIDPCGTPNKICKVSEKIHLRAPFAFYKFIKDQFLDHCFSWYMPTTSTNAQINWGCTSLVMTLTFSIRAKKDLETAVNNELQNLYNWLTANKLSLI